MRWLWIVIIFLLLAVGISALRYYKGSGSEQISPSLSPTPTIISSNVLPQRSSLFVPYWSLGYELPSAYDRLIYFGITPSISGINREEVGFQNLTTFTSLAPKNVKRSITLRMLNNTNNFTILKSPDAQKKIISETINIARRNGFDEIVLDLELKALPFDSLLKQINGFTALFYESAKKSDLRFVITQYGDTFYRVRPFDVSQIAKNSDEIMIMAYDFHKAGGNPGPNFPLNGREVYGYDFSQMIEGFQKVVPRHKITVIFGYFGYDWPTDEKGVAINTGAPFSYNEISQQYLQGCETCVVIRDETSGETKVTYKSDDNVLHTVWFEDAVSIKKKEEYLMSKGITSFSYWAHSYF